MSLDPRVADAMENVGILNSTEADALRDELERMAAEDLGTGRLAAIADADIAANRARRMSTPRR